MSSSGFDAPATVTAPPAGPNGVELECVIGFEPSNIGEVFRDVLLLGSAAAGPYEVPLMGQCVPPKPQGPIDVSKVRGRVGLIACDCCRWWFCAENRSFDTSRCCRAHCKGIMVN